MPADASVENRAEVLTRFYAAPTRRYTSTHGPLLKAADTRKPSAGTEGKQDGELGTLEDLLRCECGAHVGAIRKPHMDGPKGGPLHPTLHYPAKPTKPYRSGKRGPSKSSGR